VATRKRIFQRVAKPGTRSKTLYSNRTRQNFSRGTSQKKELRNKIGFFAPPFIGPRWFNQYPKKCRGLIESGKKLVKSSWKLLDNLRKEYSEEAVTQATDILDDAAKRIEEMAKRLEEDK
jgi:hypothetical protein